MQQSHGLFAIAKLLVTAQLYDYWLTSYIESLQQYPLTSRDKYLCQVSLKSLHYVRRYCVRSYCVTMKYVINGEQTYGHRSDGQTKGQPENVMLSAYYCWGLHK